MKDRVIFLTHADVVIDPEVPVPDWELSQEGKARHRCFSSDLALASVCSLYCSGERKARDGADAMAQALNLSPKQRLALAENDRSATGYLAKNAFEATADQFFAQPDQSVRGWETARSAQKRIVGAVQAILSEDRARGDVLIVGHGGTAALLRCYLLGKEITRDEDQPGARGGCWYDFAADMSGPPSEWRRI